MKLGKYEQLMKGSFSGTFINLSTWQYKKSNRVRQNKMYSLIGEITVVLATSAPAASRMALMSALSLNVLIWDGSCIPATT